MAERRLVILSTGLAAATFIAWPDFSIDRNSQWRTTLAGFQLQRDTGAFIGATNSLIHFHGLGERSGHVHFTLDTRLAPDRVAVDVSSPNGVLRQTLGNGPNVIDIPFGDSDHLEIPLDVTSATNPRPLRLSGLEVHRDPSGSWLVLALLPLILGGLGFLTLSCIASSGALPAAVVITLAAAAGIVAAFDPVRALSFPNQLTGMLPFAFAAGFAGLGLRRTDQVSTAIAIAGLTLSLYLQVVHSGFVYDDRLWSRPWTLSEVASTFAGSEDPLGISGQQYRPIPSITHALDHALFGSSPAAFHGTNLALHATSAFLLFALLRRLTLPHEAAFVGALAFVVHPLSASSIGWISERTDTLADIFILGTLLVVAGHHGTKPLRVLTVMLLALWSKETAVMLPALALLLVVLIFEGAERRARFASLRSMFALAVLYVAVWVSLFPEKTLGRVQSTAATLSSEKSGWIALFGGLFSQLFHPAGFETWRSTREAAPVLGWALGALCVCVSLVATSMVDPERRHGLRIAALGLLFSALVVLPFRGHNAVDIYRLGHTPALGFGLFIAGTAAVVAVGPGWRTCLLAGLILVRFAAVSRETSAAWGYPGFQFQMALRFNLDNPVLLGGLTAEMRRDIELQNLLATHLAKPIDNPFRP